jgi:carbon storage regulator
MLVLSRKRNESIVFPELNITVMVVEIRGDKIRLGIKAPKNITVHREEVFNAIERERNKTTGRPNAANKTTGGPGPDGTS